MQPSPRGAVRIESSTNESSASGVAACGVAVVTSRSRWLAASWAPKFIRASMEPVENQFLPKSQPATSGGSNRFMLMFDSGARALVSENPTQPTSFRDRTTYSTGDAYRAKYELGCQNSGESSTSRITHFMS